MLTLKELTQILLKNVPYRDTWAKGEAYGPYNTRKNKSGTVKRALYCVTPTDAVVDHFNREKYDILLTHHPFVKGVPQWIAHTALDCTNGGLNDQWRDAIGMKNAKHFDGNLGWVGEIEPTSLKDLISRCEDFVGTKLIGEHHGHEHPIKTVAICSGLGGAVEHLAEKTGADCYLIGEASKHHSMSNFKARIECGHTISEHSTGLNFFRKVLGPHGVQVDGSSLDHDKYSGEVYNRPIYDWRFSEDSDEAAVWDPYGGQPGRITPGAPFGYIPKPASGGSTWKPKFFRGTDWKQSYASDWDKEASTPDEHSDEGDVGAAGMALKPGQDPFGRGT